jgi:sec-independent protein translocase protein TatB
VVFDVGLPEIALLLLAALFVFGPERLPKVAAQAARVLRQLRDMAAGARSDLDQAIGPELRDLGVTADLGKLRDLQPKRALSRMLFDPDDESAAPTANGAGGAGGANGSTSSLASPAAGAADQPTFDPDAT